MTHRTASMDHLNQTLSHLVQREFAQPNRVVVFTRYPESGVTKTRLIPAIGPELAAKVQESLTKRTLRIAVSHCATNPCDLEVRFAGGDRVKMQDRFGFEVRYRPQPEGGLGERLVAAFQSAFDEGAQRVVVIGSDCPDIKPGILNSALESLAHCDVVVGPAIDGGYYLVGLRKPQPQLFDGIDWGSQHVMQQTFQRANSLGLRIHKLRTLPDVVRSTLASGAIAGAFRSQFDSNHRMIRLVERAVNLRSRVLQMPYGDQAMFVSADWFYRVGGFPNWPIMEDVQLCRRLKKHGAIRMASVAATSSARRWVQLGVLKTTLINQCCLAGYCLGVSPERISRWYNAKL